MAGWHLWCNGHELGQTLGDGKGQGGLACCSPWGCKESDTTGQLNDNNCWVSLSVALFRTLWSVVKSLNLVCLDYHGFAQFFYFVTHDTVLQVVVSVSTFSPPPHLLVASWAGFSFIRRTMIKFLYSRSSQFRLLQYSLICFIIEIWVSCYRVQKKRLTFFKLPFCWNPTICRAPFTIMYKASYIHYILILSNPMKLVLFFLFLF